MLDNARATPTLKQSELEKWTGKKKTWKGNKQEIIDPSREPQLIYSII
jgi:hypothetical protein